MPFSPFLAEILAIITKKLDFYAFFSRFQIILAENELILRKFANLF